MWKYAALLMLLTTRPLSAESFGYDADINYASKLWQTLKRAQLVGEQGVLSTPYPGTLPHGQVLDTIHRPLTLHGHNGTVFITRNYSANGEAPLTSEQVADHPGLYLESISVMFKREEGYDWGNRNWFWVQYTPDGRVMRNANGTSLAGRIGKGSGGGCIACHSDAPGGDMVYANDRLR